MPFRIRITEEYPWSPVDVLHVHADVLFDDLDITLAVQGAVDASKRARWAREEREKADRANAGVRIPVQVQDTEEVPPVPVPDFEPESDRPGSFPGSFEVCGVVFEDQHGPRAACVKQRGHTAGHACGHLCARPFLSEHDRPSVCDKAYGHLGGCVGHPIESPTTTPAEVAAQLDAAKESA